MSNKLPPCNDFEVCGNESDPRYIMDFSDVEPGAYIYWCSKCGPDMHSINDALQEKLNSEPGFTKKLENEINKYNN